MTEIDTGTGMDKEKDMENIFRNYSIIPDNTFHIPFHFDKHSKDISFRDFLKDLENSQKLDKDNGILQKINIFEILITHYNTESF
jgi:hypothetical protein